MTRGFGTSDASTRTLTYDGNANPVALRDAADNNGDGQPEITRLTYDGYDRLRSTIDAVGNVAKRFAPMTTPEEVAEVVPAHL